MNPHGQDLSTLLERLKRAHTRGLNVLKPGTSMKDMRAAANELGDSLLAAAANDDLWNALATTPNGGLDDGLKQELRAAIARATVGINWKEFLGRIGHQPPPSAPDYGRMFAEAITHGPDGDFDVARLRDQIRNFGDQLNALSDDPNATPRQIRRKLWKGLRFVGSCAVVAAVGMALTPVLTPIAGAVGAAGIAHALGIPVGIASDFVIEFCKEAIVKVAEKFGEGGLDQRDDDADPVPDDPAFRSLDSVDGISENTLRGLRSAWINRRGGSDTDKIATQAFIDETRRRIHEVSSTGAGTPWLSRETRKHSFALMSDLNGLEELIAEPTTDGVAVVKALGTLAVDIPRLKALLHHDVAPLQADQERNAAITACTTLIAELDEDIKSANRETTHAQNMHALHKRARSLGSVIVRDSGDTDTALPEETPAPPTGNDGSTELTGAYLPGPEWRPP